MLSLGSGVLHRGGEEVGEGGVGMLMKSGKESAEGILGLGEEPVEMVEYFTTSVKATGSRVWQVVDVKVMVYQVGERPQREEDQLSGRKRGIFFVGDDFFEETVEGMEGIGNIVHVQTEGIGEVVVLSSTLASDITHTCYHATCQLYVCNVC